MALRTHPGEILRYEFLEPMEMSATALAEKIGVPANRITEIVRGRRDVTAETALLIAEFFDTTPELWMNLQAAHDLSKAQAARAAQPKRESRSLRLQSQPVANRAAKETTAAWLSEQFAGKRASVATKAFRVSSTGRFVSRGALSERAKKK